MTTIARSIIICESNRGIDSQLTLNIHCYNNNNNNNDNDNDDNDNNDNNMKEYNKNEVLNQLFVNVCNYNSICCNTSTTYGGVINNKISNINNKIMIFCS